MEQLLIEGAAEAVQLRPDDAPCTAGPTAQLPEQVSLPEVEADSPAEQAEAPEKQMVLTEEDEESGPPAAEPQAAAPFPGLPEPLAAAMVKRGYSELTPVQEAVLEADSAGRDLSISSQTGSGKTVALGLVLAPALLEKREERGLRALVIVPTRELANQIHEELGWLYAGVSGLTVECVTGGTSQWQERGRLTRKPRVVVGTPGRLLDHIKSGSLDCSGVEELVLDEADQMLDMGFRDDLDAILGATPEGRRTHLVSATFPDGIRKLAARHQRTPVVIEGSAPGLAHEDIEHVAHLVTPRNRYAALVNLLLMSGEERTLVFVNTRIDASRLADQLSEDGFRAMALSGELQQSQRTSTLAAFRSGTVSVLVATDVAARGLDVPDVPMVVHAGTPSDGEAYTHRSGRTGRAGNKGRSVLLSPASKERAMRRTLAEAGVVVDWQPLLDAAAVQKELVKRERRRVFEAIDAEPGPNEAQIDFARRLLDARDPERIVAVLLDQSRAKSTTEARDVGAPIMPGATRPDFRDDRGGKRGRFDRGGSRGYNQRQPGGGYGQERRGGAGYGNERRGGGGYANERQGGGGYATERQGGGYGNERPGGGGYGQGRPNAAGPRIERGQRFEINWGHVGGATPQRILAHVCRRGGIPGHMVGAIRLEERTTTFEIAREAAGAFESRVRGRDSRDPKLFITRAR